MKTFTVSFTTLGLCGKTQHQVEIKAKTHRSMIKKFWLVIGDRDLVAEDSKYTVEGKTLPLFAAWY